MVLVFVRVRVIRARWAQPGVVVRASQSSDGTWAISNEHYGWIFKCSHLRKCSQHFRKIFLPLRASFVHDRRWTEVVVFVLADERKTSAISINWLIDPVLFNIYFRRSIVHHHFHH